MKDLIILELRSDLLYCQKKIKLVMAKLNVMENDETFNEHDYELLIMELNAMFNNRVEKMQELEENMKK